MSDLEDTQSTNAPVTMTPSTVGNGGNVPTPTPKKDDKGAAGPDAKNFTTPQSEPKPTNPTVAPKKKDQDKDDNNEWIAGTNRNHKDIFAFRKEFQENGGWRAVGAGILNGANEIKDGAVLKAQDAKEGVKNIHSTIKQTLNEINDGAIPKAFNEMSNAFKQGLDTNFGLKPMSKDSTKETPASTLDNVSMNDKTTTKNPGVDQADPGVDLDNAVENKM
ncbi:Uncharacterised protein [Legionella busanensis]|uniref:Uncharacterized protein n=1 Tax=Legionella busanensis TaxID=190655 RepID=A0A378JQ21_9GAMM|nr:hypothetical protein [Legionella busanensis]STX52811.1 Uncharacterised protein [Legionella busanensis]